MVRSFALSLLLLALSPGVPTPASHDMSDADMMRALRAWYATHRETPSLPVTATGAADTFITGAFDFAQFDADGNQATFVDTITIHPGDVVLWKWQHGVHTTTNGVVGDPNSGQLWDHTITVSSQEFAHAFPDEGDYPFWCTIEPPAMLGMIRVRATVPVEPKPAGIGFIGSPLPNPSTGAVAFRLAVDRAMRARVEIYDARGRLVAVPVDRELPAGPFSGAWDGRSRQGDRPAPGVYYLRLRAGRVTDQRRFVLDR